MASTRKTNLGLNQWDASDKPVREDFVKDNETIDQELAQLKSALSYTSQATYTTSYGLTIHATRKGAFVNLWVTGEPSNLTASTSNQLTTLPSEYRPALYPGWNTYVTQGKNKVNFLLRVETNGQVFLNPANGGMTEYVNVRYSYMA